MVPVRSDSKAIFALSGENSGARLYPFDVAICRLESFSAILLRFKLQMLELPFDLIEHSQLFPSPSQTVIKRGELLHQPLFV